MIRRDEDRPKIASGAVEINEGDEHVGPGRS